MEHAFGSSFMRCNPNKLLVLQRYFIPTARQTRRQKKKLCSPIYAHFSETLNGAQTIRAYKQQDRFIKRNIDTIEAFNIFNYFERFQNRFVVSGIEWRGIFICHDSPIKGHSRNRPKGRRTKSSFAP